jgi:hypothetical protein
MDIRRGNEDHLLLRNEDHLLLRNEGTHLGVQMVEHLILVKGSGTGLRPEAFLEGMFTS